MAKTANINVRIDPETKAGAEIMNGNISTKSYFSARELFAELDAEMDGE